MKKTLRSLWRMLWLLVYSAIALFVAVAIVLGYMNLRGDISELEWTIAMGVTWLMIFILLSFPMGVVIRSKDPSWRTHRSDWQKLLSYFRGTNQHRHSQQSDAENEFD